ncbi:MAG TPA: DMT family transporter [Gemmatimonadales bacterium]|nr:DMT family transporter [Gemmatimonadales bacterium]
MPAPPPIPQVTRAYLALLGAQVAFGLFPVFGQVAFRPGGLAPLAVGAWRLVGGAVILGALAAVFHGRAAIPARAHLARFVVSAFLGVAINQGLFLVGLSRSTPLNATLVMCLIPVFTFVIAAAVGQEYFSAARLLGVIIALAGTLPLLFEDGLHSLGRYGLGNLLMVANALCYSGYLIVSKPLARRYPPLVVITWAYILSLPFVAYFGWGVALLPGGGDPAVWWSLAYIIAFPTVLAYLFNMYALARVPASTTAVFIYAQPIIAAVASWLAFHETPSAGMLVATVCLFAGIWLVTRRPEAVEAPEAA